MRKDFDSLVAEFCKLCGIASPDASAGEMPVEVEGVEFVLSYDEEVAPDRVLLFCDYGQVPTEIQLPAYRALLETNLYTFRRDTAVFTIAPDSGRVLCATRFRVRPLHADELRGAMTIMSRKARDWREHFFINASTLPAKGPSAEIQRRLRAKPLDSA